MKQFKPWTKDDLIKYDKMIQAKRGAKYIAKQLGKSVDDVKHHQLELFTKKLNDKLDGKDTKPLSGSTQMSAIEIVRADGKDIIMKELKKGSVRLGELSRLTQLSKEVVAEIVDEIQINTGLPLVLEDNGFLHVDTNFSQRPVINPIDLDLIKRDTIKIGVVSDTHFCSKYQQLTLLHTAYSVFEKEKISFAVHAGDVTDGSPQMHAGIQHEQFITLFDQQVQYVIDNYPKSKKFKTFVRLGNHDASWIKSNAGDPVRLACSQREDLIYLEPDQAAFKHSGSDPLVQLYHPAGGNGYAKSYRGQKIYESAISKAISEATSLWTGDSAGKIEIPRVLIIGHLHVLNICLEGWTYVMTAPCFQSQTPYLRDKALNPYVGFMILEFTISKTNDITGFVPDIRVLNHLIRKNDY